MIHKPDPTVSDLPVSLFKVIGKEIRNKQKVYNALSSLIEDLYEAENALGKSLLRIGSVPLGFKTDVVMCGISSLWSNMYKSSTQLIGKQHCNLSVTVMQNVCKIFPEHAKSNIKAIQAIIAKIDGQLDEHRRSVKSYQKYYDKYSKLALEIELTVKNRKNASLELEQQSNKNNNNSDKDIASSSSQSIASQKDSQNEGFINTIKMLTKNTPADVQKRLNDKCRDLVKDFDAAEAMLIAQSRKLLDNEEALIHDIEKAILKLDDMETSRMKMLREGLNRLYLAEHLLVQRLEEIIDPIKEEMLALDVATEFVNIELFLEKMIDNNESSGTSSDHEGGNSEKISPNPNKESVVIFSRLENLSTCLEFFKSMLSREMTITQEFSEAERIYSRSIGRALEKNGYGRSVGPSVVSHQMTCAEMLASFESPSIRLGWETSINVFDSFSELHNSAADVYSQTIFSALESLFSKIDGTKKELTEVQTIAIKNVENAQHIVSKLSKKLVKTKGLLNEKREAMRLAREDVANEGGNSNGNGPANSSESGADYSSSMTSNDSTSGSGNNSNLIRKRNQGQEAMLQGIEKLGTSFRTTNLSVGLGLETAPERVVRIEAKVLSLEAEEIELTQAVHDAIVKLDAVSDAAKEEAMAIARVCKTAIEEGLTECKTIMKLFLDIFLKNIQTSKNNIYLLKQSCEGIEIDEDKLRFYENILQISESIKSGNSSVSNADYDYTPLLIDLTPFQPFESLDNKLISDERKILGMSMGLQSASFPDDTVSSIVVKRSVNQETNNTEICDVDNKKTNIVGIAREINLPSESSANAVMALATPLSPVPPLEIIKHITANHFETMSTPSRQNGSLSPTSTSKEVYDLQAISTANSVLAQFGLQGQDKILESYVCALYPKKGFLVQGRMYVTQSYVAFSGWPETRVLLPMSSLVTIEKMNTLNFIPNAIMLRTASEEYFFGSFIDRDPCHALLVSMSSVAKRIGELHGNDLESTSNLVFGYQTVVKQNLLAAIGLDIGDFDLLSDNKSPVSNQPSQSIVTEISTPQKYIYTNNGGKTEAIESLNKVNKESNNIDASSFKSAKEENSKLLPITSKYSSLFAVHNIIPLHEEAISFSAKEVYGSLWSKTQGYESFLVSEGDLNISASEWVSNENVMVKEDPTSISFTQTRCVEYAHPRTTMLMFGPKNAPARQAHYLHTDRTDDGDGISSFVLLTITQFEGIPLSDCFKIYQYWICEDTQSNGPSIVRMGMFVHIMKATLFKAQIIAGSKEELTVMCERWVRYAVHRLDGQVPPASPDTSAIRKSISEPQQSDHTSQNNLLAVQPQSLRSKQRRISKDVFSGNVDETSPEKTDKNNVKDKKISSNTSYSSVVATIFIIMALVMYCQFRYNQSLSLLNSKLRSELDALNRLVQSHESMLRDINKVIGYAAQR